MFFGSGGGAAEMVPSDESNRASFILQDLASPAFPSFWSDPFCKRDFTRENLRRHLPRVAVAAVFHVTCLYINNVSQAWLQANIAGYYEDRWVPVHNETGPLTLWDWTFQTLPYVNTTAPANIMAGIPIAVALIRFCIVPGPRSLRWEIMQRVFVIWGLLWFWRGCTIIITPLPNPDHTCQAYISHPHNIWLEGFEFMPLIGHGDVTCQDVLFSGHTVALTMGCFTLMKYTLDAPWSPPPRAIAYHYISRILACTYMLVGYYFIIASHFHYTLDVLVGSVLCTLTFHGYHYFLQAAYAERNIPRYSFKRVLHWLEHYADDLRAERLLQEPPRAPASWRAVDGTQVEAKLAMAHAYGKGLVDGELPLVHTDPFGRDDFAALRWRCLRGGSTRDVEAPPTVTSTLAEAGTVRNISSSLRSLSRALVACLVFLLGNYMKCLAEAHMARYVTGYYASRWQPKPPETRNVTLWDAADQSLPEIKAGWTIYQLLVVAPDLFCIVRFLIIPGPMSLRWTLVKRILVIMGAIWFFRGLALFVTALPNPDTPCEPYAKNVNNIDSSIFLNALEILFVKEFSSTCADVFLSRHAVFLTLSCLTWVMYRERSPWRSYEVVPDDGYCNMLRIANVVISCSMVVLVCIGYFIILASRWDYTVDVLIVVLATILVWGLYHSMICSAWLPAPRLFSAPLCRFIRWFEVDAKDVKLWRNLARGGHGSAVQIFSEILTSVRES